METIRRAVYQYDLKGCFEKEYSSLSAAARENHVSPSNISFAANNGTVSAGCLWHWEKVQQLSRERLQGIKPRRAKPETPDKNPIKQPHKYGA